MVTQGMSSLTISREGMHHASSNSSLLKSAYNDTQLFLTVVILALYTCVNYVRFLLMSFGFWRFPHFFAGPHPEVK